MNSVSRVQRFIEEASYNSDVIERSGFMRQARESRPDDRYESTGAQALMALARAQNPNIKWDFDHTQKSNERLTALYNNAEANIR